MKTVIIQGSSRRNGNSSQIAQILAGQLDATIIDLKAFTINTYSYEHEHLNDDFIGVMKKIIEYDTLIFVTPVYWYSMSGIMKTFFDRITDCLKVEKEIGRKLRGKNMATVACGSDDIQTLGFFEPFRLSAEYLGMLYLGDIHTWIAEEPRREELIEELHEFTSRITSV